MTDFLETMWKTVAASTLVGAAFFGAVGGITSALAINVKREELVRQIALGALAAGGMGSGGGAVVAAWLDIDWSLIPAGGATGTMSYLIGVFGPAIIEVILGRLKAGRMPNEPAPPSKQTPTDDGGEG